MRRVILEMIGIARVVIVWIFRKDGLNIMIRKPSNTIIITRKKVPRRGMVMVSPLNSFLLPTILQQCVSHDPPIVPVPHLLLHPVPLPVPHPVRVPVLVPVHHLLPHPVCRWSPVSRWHPVPHPRFLCNPVPHPVRHRVPHRPPHPPSQSNPVRHPVRHPVPNPVCPWHPVCRSNPPMFLRSVSCLRPHPVTVLRPHPPSV
mmetsp:Transcript_42387/g.47883  ORF Transcript_42387/g.47883 Transcript_42387/m.47883 type:complete len:201 (-) Transcript_42387:95-697(-)